jgi:hypothetical protein
MRMAAWLLPRCLGLAKQLESFGMVDAHAGAAQDLQGGQVNGLALLEIKKLERG